MKVSAQIIKFPGKKLFKKPMSSDKARICALYDMKAITLEEFLLWLREGGHI